jgi:hypothetical protein
MRKDPQPPSTATVAEHQDWYERNMLSPRGETPKQILNRLAREMNCEPRQVADRVIRMLEERKR